MYDDTVLDMIELGVVNYKGLSEFDADKIAIGIKPCLLFAGPQFEQNPDLKRLQNLLVDFLQREKVNAVRLQGLEHSVMFTADGDNVYMRSYRFVFNFIYFCFKRLMVLYYFFHLQNTGCTKKKSLV